MKKIKNLSKNVPFHLTLNEEYATAIKISPEALSYYKEALPKTTPDQLDIPVKFVKLLGPKGESAHVSYTAPSNTLNLACQFPFDMTSENQRAWIMTASNYFKPRLTKDCEVVSPAGPFKKIVRGSYKESSGTCYDPDDPTNKNKWDPFLARMRTYEGRSNDRFGGDGPGIKNRKRNRLCKPAWTFIRKLWSTFSYFEVEKYRLEKIENDYNEHPNVVTQKSGWPDLRGKTLLKFCQTKTFKKLFSPSKI